MGYKTKIDWANATWNPVTGCLHGCEYCYARRIATRFSAEHMERTFIGTGKNWYFDGPKELEYPVEVNGVITPYPFGFAPTFHCYRLDIPARWTKPRTIFVCSMADLFGEWVPDEWIREVFMACKAAPQHRYLFLTKNPARYTALMERGIILPSNIDWWYGYTIDGTKPVPREAPIGRRVFVSVEPILRRPDGAMLDDIAKASWVIVGAESGNRKGKIKPEKEWIDEIVRERDNYGTPVVFMKESLRFIMGKDFRQEFPWNN